MESVEAVRGGEFKIMANLTGKKGTFVVQILNQQNATWQGTVNWMEEKETQPFRSLLELIRLMDSALESENAESDAES
jgi:hypothetical protein